jgi:hypothetical protein
MNPSFGNKTSRALTHLEIGPHPLNTRPPRCCRARDNRGDSSMRPAFEDLKNFWILAYSRGAFLEVVRFVDAMQRTAAFSIERQALTHAAVVSYARPFTKSQITRDQRVIPLNGVLPPPRLASLHEELLAMRNTVIGHKDATLGKGKSGVPNMVIIYRGEGEKTSLRTIAIANFSPAKLLAIRELCAHFIKHCDEQGHPIMVRCKSAVFSLRRGVYGLSVSKPPDKWATPIDDSWLANHSTFPND